MKSSIGVAAQSTLGRHRRLGCGQWLKTPMPSPRLQVEGGGRPGTLAGGGRLVSPRRAAADPFDERGDLVGRQLRLGGHLIGLAVANRVDQQALVRLARHDGRRRVAPLEHCGPRVEPQVALLFGLAVALVAAGGQQRPHLLFEELHVGRVARIGRSARDRGGSRCRRRVRGLVTGCRPSSQRPQDRREQGAATKGMHERHSDESTGGTRRPVSQRAKSSWTNDSVPKVEYSTPRPAGQRLEVVARLRTRRPSAKKSSPLAVEKARFWDALPRWKPRRTIYRPAGHRCGRGLSARCWRRRPDR